MTTFQAVIALITLTAVCSAINVVTLRFAPKAAPRMFVANNYICWIALIGSLFIAPKAGLIAFGFIAAVFAISAAGMLIASKRCNMTSKESLKVIATIFANSFRTQLGFKPVEVK